MDKEIKQRWLKALRSGEYKQSRGGLHTREGGFCCLGVLCDLHAKETGNKWRMPEYAKPRETEYLTYLRSSTFLPDEVMLWANLLEGEQSKLANMNDTGRAFEEIADYIERTL